MKAQLVRDDEPRIRPAQNTAVPGIPNDDANNFRKYPLSHFAEIIKIQTPGIRNDIFEERKCRMKRGIDRGNDLVDEKN